MRKLLLCNVARTVMLTSLVLFLTGFSALLGQERTVKGTVYDGEGLTLPGATVVIKGQPTTGTTTGADGNYSIDVMSPDATLVFSFVGMKSVEVTVGDQSTIDVTLEYDVIGLEELVVVGYGTLQRREITNSITSVKSDEFVKGAVDNVGELIQGKVAGLIVTSTSGSPTASPEILLRGVGTLMSGVSPLVIIDGIPGSLNQVAPEDIESIDILKDGSAAAIYGTRGSNGVILITTKKVRGTTPTTVEVNSYYTTDRITKRLEFLTADDVRGLADEGNIYAIDYGYNTDWQDQIYQNPVSSNYNVSIRNGDSESSYYANLNYKSRDGLIKRSDNNVLTSRLELTNSMFDNKLRMNANIIGRIQHYYPGSWNAVYEQALTRNPTDRAADDDGNWIEYPAMNRYENPMAHLYEKEGEVRNTTLKTYGSISYNIVPGLEAKVTGSFEDVSSLQGWAYTLDHIRNIKNSEGGSATRYSNKSRTKLFESILRYDKVINEIHNIKLLLGQSWQDNAFESFRAYNHLFPTDFYTWNNLGAGQGIKEGTASMSSYKESSKLIAYFFRGNYSYDDRYLLMATLRREGSSKFGENHKWGLFPAVSAGWNMKNESFMQGIDALSTLKLRGGYGLTGTIPSNPYNALRKLTYDTGGYVFVAGEWIPGLITSSNPNPNLRWEKKAETNIGLDFGFFNDRFAGSVDLYHRKTTDIIWSYPVPSPPNLYTSVVANAGSMENKGIEVFLSGLPLKKGNWTWRTSANFTTNRNKLISLSNDEFQNENPYINAGDAGRATREYTHKLEEGGPIGNFYGYRSVGVDENGMWLVETDEGPKLLVDAVEADKQVLGNGVPKYYINWNNTVEYRNFDLNIVMRGAFDYQILNQPQLLHGVPSEFRRSNVLRNSFTHEVYGLLSMDQDATYVSEFLEDGDYWKVDNITLGYNWVPGESLAAIGSCRFYASVTNIFTLTGYTGIDPEVTMTNIAARAPGIDYVKRYPATRTFTVGLTVLFR
ncbi:MAG: SusC/RagA family TonB-linked outer membrane protein [Bacteroidales bacterium]